MATEREAQEPGAHGSGDHESGDGVPEDGQVSAVSGMAGKPDPISPEDATAGYPPSESGHPQEGTAGSNTPPRHNPPEPGKQIVAVAGSAKLPLSSP